MRFRLRNRISRSRHASGSRFFFCGSRLPPTFAIGKSGSACEGISLFGLVVAFDSKSRAADALHGLVLFSSLSGMPHTFIGMPAAGAVSPRTVKHLGTI